MIFACALMDRLIADARAGDRAAIERLVRMLPADMPPAKRAARRAECIQRMAEQLRRALPEATDRRIARILAAAGERIEAKHLGLEGDEFAGLTAEELAWLALEVRHIVTWAPRRADGSAWLRLRQIQTLISG